MASGKLKSLDFKKRQDIVEFKLSDISITRQSELVGVARSGFLFEVVATVVLDL